MFVDDIYVYTIHYNFPKETTRFRFTIINIYLKELNYCHKKNILQLFLEFSSTHINDLTYTN